MAENIQMLALSPTMENGTIVKWVKKVGDRIKQGEVICEVETDKATMEFESQAEGVLLKIIVPEGSQAAVGDVIAIVGKEGEDILPTAEPKTTTTPEVEKTPRKAESVLAQPAAKSGGVLSTPLARKLAQENNIDLSTLAGTGPDGRIIIRDVELAIEARKKM